MKTIIKAIARVFASKPEATQLGYYDRFTGMSEPFKAEEQCSGQ